MTFYSLSSNIPNNGQIVLIKFISHGYPDCQYYVCRALYSKKYKQPEYDWCFVQACGEEYYTFSSDEIIGWMPIQDLNDIQVK